MEFEFQWKTFGDQGNQKKKKKTSNLFLQRNLNIE